MTSLYHLFPSTIHPMVIHFTIAFVFLTALVGIIGLFVKNDEFFGKAFFLLLILSIFATLAAGVAGVISQSYLTHIPSAVRGTFEDHKDAGELTGILLLIAFAFQWLKRRNAVRVSLLAVMVCSIAVITVSVAGHFGGNAVYDHGVGVMLGK